MNHRIRVQGFAASVVTVMIATAMVSAEAGSKGFADKPGGGKDDPLLRVAISVLPNIGFDLEEGVDPCSNYGLDLQTSNLTVKPILPVIPNFSNGSNQFLSIRFPFKISSPKFKKTIMEPGITYIAQSFLTGQIQITDEVGAHVPGIATINGRDAAGVSRKFEPNFPAWLDEDGKNQLVDPKTFLYVSDDSDQDLATIAAFGPTPGDPLTSNIRELRVRVGEVGGIIINGFWTVKIGVNDEPISPVPLTYDAAVPDKPVIPNQLVNGNLLVKANSRFTVSFSEPIAPPSIGIGNSFAKAFGKTGPDVPAFFQGNVGVLRMPCDGSPAFPNFRLRMSPQVGDAYDVPFDVRPINPNNLAQYVITPAGPLVEGTLVLGCIPLSANFHSIDGFGFDSAITTRYGVPFDSSNPFQNSYTFAIDGK